MSYFKFHDLSKKTERLQKEISDSKPVWGENEEDDSQQLHQVKKKWLKQQNQEFQKLKQQQSQNRNIKTVVFTLVSITLVAIALPFVPKLWRISVESIAELIPENTQADGKPKQGRFLEKLKTMQEEYKQKEKVQQLVNACEKDPLKTPADCQKIAETTTAENQNSITGDTGNQEGEENTIGDQLVDSLNSIDQYNKDLKRAIEMSD